MGLAVELTAWVLRWRDDGVGLVIEGQRCGSRSGGADGVGLTIELGGGLTVVVLILS